MSRILVVLLIFSSGLSAQTMVLKSAQGVDPREGCLTTSLAAYQAASNNTFVSCTSTEYACIQGLSTTYGATNAGMDNPPSGTAGGSMVLLNTVPQNEVLLGFRYRPESTTNRIFLWGPASAIFHQGVAAQGGTGGGQRWYVFKGDGILSDGTYVWGAWNNGSMKYTGNSCNTYYTSGLVADGGSIPPSNTSTCYAIQSLWKQKTW